MIDGCISANLQAEFGRWKEERRFIEVNIGIDMLVNI